MRLRILALFVVVLVCAVAGAAQTVVESESKASIRENYAAVELSVNSDAEMAGILLSAELIDTGGNIRSQIPAKNYALHPGKQSIVLLLPIADILAEKDTDIAWYRLHYRLGESSGTISMSQLMPDLFEMRVIASENLMSGINYRVRIRAANPFTGKPAAEVKIETTVNLHLEGEGEPRLKLTGAGETDAEGFATIDYSIPPETKLDDDSEIKITGRKNGLVSEAIEELSALKSDEQFLIMTDKPIYQPDQMLNVRGILMKGVDGKIVLSGSTVQFTITDEDDTILYREKVQSSDFGIASIGWRIPSNAKLGNYRIDVSNESNSHVGGRQFKVSRYDLPNFAVEAKAEKPYYLPGDSDARIEVSANYLFGKPVTKGKVRVVQEIGREWDWKAQKYSIEEGQVRQGATDADGKYLATVDLNDAQKELKEEEYGGKYKDIKFTAYFTDATTNKTEQRRFDVRISKEPIHVYFYGSRSDHNPELPVNGYVSTFYADGTPAECDVEIKASPEDENKFKTVGHIRTNSFGAGKLSLMHPATDDADDNLDFTLIAKDAKGNRGKFKETISFEENAAEVQIDSDRTIYKPGEPMIISIRSTIKTGMVYIDLEKGWSVIDSHTVELIDGRAEIRIPYIEAFKGALSVNGFIEDPDDHIVSVSRGVIFPAHQGITVDAGFDKAVYKPNEEATISFGVVDALGQAVQTALGVVVLDKAVEERAQSDDKFVSIWQDVSGFIGYGSSFGDINFKDLNDLDLSKPISDEMQMVAAVILRGSYYAPNIFRSNNYNASAGSVFASLVEKQFAPVGAVLRDAFEHRNSLHPVDLAGLESILRDGHLDFESFRDPWGMGYKCEFRLIKDDDVLNVISAGPDKQFDTADDFTAYSTRFKYFIPAGKAIDAAVKNYHERTGEFIRDEKTLFAELGINEMLDRFGRPYRIVFETEGRYLNIRIRSNGVDGIFEKSDFSVYDDFYVWTNKIDYFAGTERKIVQIENSVKNAPSDEAEFRASLRSGGLDFDKMRDGFGNPFYVVVEKRSRYWDKVTIENAQNYGDTTSTQRRTITPVTQQVIEFTIRSSGKDRKRGTGDDFTLTYVTHVLSEQTKDDPKPVPLIRKISYRQSTGSIAGIVFDPSGHSIATATVTATNAETKVDRTTTADGEGRYLIVNLTAGKYSVKASATGFANSIVDNVPVSANATSTADLVLSVGGQNATVDVSADEELTVDVSSSKTSTSVSSMQINSIPVNARRGLELVLLTPGTLGTKEETSTPRLREYFPETLFWQPEIITGPDGKAQVKFRMADSITTWKMYTIASTRNGKIGVAEKEVTAFQPFFVDLDPPKFLTVGDEIYLPSQVRNYTGKKQKADVTMAGAPWFSFLGADKQQINVETDKSQNTVFGFKAITSIRDGKQRVTAIAETDSDAIEKPVTVRPDGQEVVRTESRVAAGIASLEANFPANALPESQSAELKIYPNLFAHVAESVQGMLERPYGCGEQTVSSTYPNLMILKFVKADSPLRAKAQTYLQQGYERLLGYQVADGGFSYWGTRDESQVALTAYALRFLRDASSEIKVDDDVIAKAQEWLVKQQRADGSWTKRYYGETVDDPERTKMLTTYVARSLAMQKDSDKGALKKALVYLEARNTEIDEPYSLALYGLAALDSGNEKIAAGIAARLEKMAIEEGNGAYWSLETNTPFYGWGTAGRIETTALVLQLLIRDAAVRRDGGEARKAVIARGTLFLLKNKDRYGVWYSTQTTINVLDAFLATLAGAMTAENQTLEVSLNGELIKTVSVTPDKIDPVTIDLYGKLKSTANHLEVKSSGKATIMSQIVSTHYVDWHDSEAANRNVNNSRAIRLDYKCDKTTAAIMDSINCTVEAERVGFKGYGMLLAEIGVPPGADVSRESLEKAIESDSNISHYEILPDRIVVYMWAEAGGTKFNFKFKPRYAINAQTPASVVYDYYNPEAQATIAPLRFVVK